MEISKLMMGSDEERSHSAGLIVLFGVRYLDPAVHALIDRLDLEWKICSRATCRIQKPTKGQRSIEDRWVRWDCTVINKSDVHCLPMFHHGPAKMWLTSMGEALVSTSTCHELEGSTGKEQPFPHRPTGWTWRRFDVWRLPQQTLLGNIHKQSQRRFEKSLERHRRTYISEPWYHKTNHTRT